MFIDTGRIRKVGFKVNEYAQCSIGSLLEV